MCRSHDTERPNTNAPAVMGQGDEKAELFDKIDDLADDELTEMQRRLERAREHIDDAGRVIVAQLEGEPSRKPAAPTMSGAKATPALSETAAKAKSELEAFLAQTAPAAPEAPAAKSVAPKAPTSPVIRDASDFGDIAANIANDDWQKP